MIELMMWFLGSMFVGAGVIVVIASQLSEYWSSQPACVVRGPDTLQSDLYHVDDMKVPWLQQVDTPLIIMFNAERKLPYRGFVRRDDLVVAARQFSTGVQGARLDDSNFEHDTQASTGSTTGDWLIVFDTMDIVSLPHYDGLATSLRARGVNLGVVDAVQSPRTAKRFSATPGTVKMILLQKGSLFTHPVKLTRASTLSMIEFALMKHKNYPKSLIPRQVMLFDEVTDFLVQHYKALEGKYGRESMWLVGAFAVFAIMTVVGILLACCFWATSSAEHKSTPTAASSGRTTRSSTMRKSKKE